MKKHVPIIAFLLFAWNLSHAQILHTENFSVILDTAKNFKGNILPSFKYQNLREDLIKFENTADFSLRFGQNALTMANRFELSKFGEETFQSGGYVYLEYRAISKASPFALEPYGQVHWNEVRGLDRKYAGGLNFRWRIVSNETTGFFAGIGPFYEFERWDFRGVRANVELPNDRSPIERELWRLGSYISFKQEVAEKVILDFSVYYQNSYDQLFTDPRLGSSARITYMLTKFLGLTLLYQNIYDPAPLVPIPELFHDLTFSVNISL